MNRVAPGYPKRRRASLFTGSRRGPGSYEQRRANIDAGSPEVVAPASPPASYEQPRAKICQTSADSTCRRPRVSNPAHSIPGAIAGEPAHSIPGAVAVRWEPPHSCGGGALQRSEQALPLSMRFSAGDFGASPSSISNLKLEPPNPIRHCSPAAASRVQSNRGLNPPQDSSRRFVNLSRLETTPILCFVRLTPVSIRPHVSVRDPRFATVFALSPSHSSHLDASQNNQITLRKSQPTQTRPVRHDLRVNQSHG